MLFELQNQIFGHDEIATQFLNAFTSEKLHHAWLFTGERGMGKSTIAKAIAKFLLTNPQNPQSVFEDADPKVARKMDNASHPDYLFIGLLEGDKEIKVEQARELQRFASTRPLEGKYKVVVIDPIDDFNTNSCNALLKILEEPPQNFIFLIVCHSLGAVLPTIKSRVKTVQVKPLSYPDFKKALLQLDFAEDKIDPLYELSQGSLHVALQFAQDEQLDLYQQVKHVVRNATPTLMDIKNLSDLVTQEDNWELFKYSIRRVMHEWLVACDITLKKKVLDKIEQINLRLNSCDNQHLDKQQTVLTILL
ncbi:MAG: AAA family ATPase [Rickettsiales bacterium]